MSVNVGDSLEIDMKLQGTVWVQTVTDVQTGNSVSYSYDLQGQQQEWAIFMIEGYSQSPVSPVQFNNTTITFANAASVQYYISPAGGSDTYTVPVASNNNTQLFIQAIVLQ
jgi:hypothetical protein